MSANTANMDLIEVKFDLFLAYNEPLDVMRKISCFFFYVLKTKRHYLICNTPSAWCGIMRFQNAHPAEIPLFSSSLLDFLFFVLFSSHSNPEKYSFTFLKLCESMTNMMGTCLLWDQLIEFYYENCNPF